MDKLLLVSVVIVSIAFFATIASGCFILFQDVFKPAYLSLIADCHPQATEILAQSGYVVSGIYSASVDENRTITNESITINMNVTADAESTMIHELCHQRQAHEGRMPTCSQPLRLYFAEAECYRTERMYSTLAAYRSHTNQ